MTDRSTLQDLNDRITALEEEIHSCDIILDDINVPSKTTSGRDLALSARLQWLKNYVQLSMKYNKRSRPPIFIFHVGPHKPPLFSKN